MSMDFLTFLIQLIVTTILFVGPIAAGYLIWKIRRTSKVIEQVTSKKYTLLRILVPKQNDKTPQAAEEMFASIHGIYRPDQEIQDHLSFELAARDQYIQFFAYVPVELKDFVEGQIYAQYPTVEISEVQDYTSMDLSQWSVAAAELTLTKADFYPIKSFNSFQVDPLAGITSVLSKVEEGEQVWVQILMRPVPDTWQEQALEYVKATQEGKKLGKDPLTFGKVFKAAWGVMMEIARTGLGLAAPAKDEKKDKPALPGPVAEALKGVEGKTTKLGFQTIIRVCAIARDEPTATSKINNLLGAFKQYNVTNMNGFTISKIATDKEKILPVFQTRAFPSNGYIFNTEELASIFHLPSSSVETPSIVWAGAKKGEPPANLPIEGLVSQDQVTLFGQANYRHFNHRFGIKIPDRRYHMYAIGKTGTGKSTMLRNMIIDDIQKGRGVCVVDPHGDLINHVLDYIPDHRIDDIVYFNPADREHPIGFNLLESVDPDLKNIVASGLMSIFTKLWANVWSARMEYILRNVILALLEYPEATMLEIMKLLVDPVFRRKVLYHVKDPVIRAFFLEEYDKWDPKFRTEAIASLQNKVGQFLSSSTIRNIMGQKKSTIDMRQIMDEGKILLVDLSVGKIGEDNAALLGSMVITKIQLSAMGRADTPEEQRRDFYLYVDEFQNFATDSFAVILSEARKYRLNLIIAHQYIAQMSEVVASAVFGNVGTIVAFRVGASDAGALAREFEPVFNANDLVNLDNYHVYLKMAIDARTAAPFSAVTLPPFSGKNENRATAIHKSIERYTVDRQVIEAEIETRNEANSGKIGTLVEVDGEVVYKEEMKPYEPMNPLPKNTVLDGREVWKIRDKEGKPYYVSGFDYDQYMEAKGKPSDRPGAEATAVDPESMTSTAGEAQIRETQVRAQTQTPVPTPTPASTPIPTPAAAAPTAPAAPVLPTTPPSEKRGESGSSLNVASSSTSASSSRDRQRSGHHSERLDRSKQRHAGQAERQNERQARQGHREETNIVRHKNTEKKFEKPLSESPAPLTSPANTLPQLVEEGQSQLQKTEPQQQAVTPVVPSNDQLVPTQPIPTQPVVQPVQPSNSQTAPQPAPQSAPQASVPDTVLPIQEL